MIRIGVLQEIIDGFDFTNLFSILLSIIPVLICITFHELSHGYAAYLLGDDTAKQMGRLSLNPLKHLDPIGALMMLVFHFGWAKPVPINMMRFRNPKRGMALSAMAGPASNLLLALVFMFLYGLTFLPLRGSPVGAYILEVLNLTAYLSVSLAVFNLIPVPPLDGSKVLFSFISDKNYYKLMVYERYGSILMIILLSTGLLRRPLAALVSFIFNLLVPIADFGFEIVLNLFFV